MASRRPLEVVKSPTLHYRVGLEAPLPTAANSLGIWVGEKEAHAIQPKNAGATGGQKHRPKAKGNRRQCRMFLGSAIKATAGGAAPHMRALSGRHPRGRPSGHRASWTRPLAADMPSWRHQLSVRRGRKRRMLRRFGRWGRGKLGNLEFRTYMATVALHTNRCCHVYVLTNPSGG